MKMLISLVFVYFVTGTTTASVAGRIKRQAVPVNDEIDLSKCFEEWAKDTTTWIDNVARATTSILNLFVNQHAANEAAMAELQRQFSAVFDPTLLLVSEAECQRQLEATKDTLRRAIEQKWQMLVRDLEVQLQKAQQDLANAFQAFTALFSQLNPNNNNNTINKNANNNGSTSITINLPNLGNIGKK